jgi:hypothetical protein
MQTQVVTHVEAKGASQFRENRPPVDPAAQCRDQRSAKLLLELVELTGIEPVTS